MEFGLAEGPKEFKRNPPKALINLVTVTAVLLGGAEAIQYAGKKVFSSSISGESAPTASQSYESPNRNLGYKRLIAIQTALADRGLYPANKIDGEPGPATDTALAAFQASVGLSPDGVYGAKTRNALFPSPKVEASADDTSDEILSRHDAIRAAKDVLTVAKGVRHAPEGLLEKGIEGALDLLDGEDKPDHKKRRHS